MPDATQEKTKDADAKNGAEAKPRVASKYVVFVERSAPVGDEETERIIAVPLLDGAGKHRVFQGFRADDVLDEVLDGDYGVKVDEKTNKSSYVYIIPASKVHRMRGSVQVERSVTAERG